MRKVFVLVLVSLIVMLTMPLIFTNVALANATDAGYINITADAAKQMIDENQNTVILDVRTLAEYKSGHIEGAKLIPLLELEERINAIDGNSAVIVYCRRGVKSEKASKILLDHGFDKVYNMKVGLNAWQDARFPVVSGSIANHIFPSKDSLSSEIEEILNSGKPVFLFLYVDWCRFCQQQIPIIDELEQEYNGKITFFRVNCEEHPKAMKEFGASGYPSMFLMDKGDDEQYKSQYFKGFTDKETLKESIYWIIANGSINKNSKDNELGICASPTLLIDDEDYTVTLARAASAPLEASMCPSSAPGVTPMDPGIPSGSLCRGACGGDCPNTCRDLPNINICDPDGEHFVCSYKVIECGSHLGCRVHDACYDACWPESCPNLFSTCCNNCDSNCTSVYGTWTCLVRWARGLESSDHPHDRWLKFSDLPDDPPTACVGSTPYCVGGKCVECRTNADCDDLDSYGDWVSYCSGDTVRKHRLFHDFSCSGGTCTDHTSWVDDQWVEDCSDSWYDTGTKRWITDPANECKEKEQKEQKQRDYTCWEGLCIFNIAGTQWVDTGNTRNKADGTDCGYFYMGWDYCSGDEVWRFSETHDYSCVGGVCVDDITEEDEFVEDCNDYDYYDGLVNYCSGDTVRKHRLFHDFSCSGGTCTDHTSWVDDQLVEACPADYYDGWVYYCSGGNTVRKIRLFHDFYCSEGTCTEDIIWVDDQLVETCPADYYDGWVYYCSGDTVRKHRLFHDFYCSEGTCTEVTSWVDDQLVETCPADYWGCVDSSTVGLYHCTCVSGSLYWEVIDTYDCLEGEVCVDGVCEEEVPEFPAGVTAVFGATFFIFLMMRKKYVRK